MKIFTSILSQFLCYSIASCIGGPEKETTTRLSHGSTASPGFFPYIVEVKLLHEFHCGGVIISEDWVLTAATCLWEGGGNVPIEDVSVRVGSVNRITPEPGSFIVSIDRYVIHNDWDLLVNNVALLHLKQPLVFTEVVQPAQLAEQSKPIDMSVPATMVGWGGDHVNSMPVDVLRYNTNVKLIDQRYCNYFVITPDSICSNSTSPNSATCAGDDGGPLLQLDSTSGMVLYGIASAFDCLADVNTFYESIINHRVWIHLVSGV